MISDTGAVLDSSTSDEDDGVFLEVVTFTGDVGCYGTTVAELNAGDFTDGRVGFLGFRGEDLTADSLDEGFGFEGRDFVDGRSMRFTCSSKVLLQSNAEGGRAGEGSG